jgi:Tol biopolymer transport system component
MRHGFSALVGAVLLATELLGPVRASQKGADGDPSWPQNIEVAPPLQPVLDRLWEVSPTFRRQCARIAAARDLTVRVLAEDRPRQPSIAARSVFSFRGVSLASAGVFVDPTPDAAQLLAHEFEHILEQLDGVNLVEHAGNGAVWRSADNHFETQRAAEAGWRAARELARLPGDVATQINRPGTVASRPLAASLANPDATGPSDRPARIALGRYLVFVSRAQLAAQDRNDLTDVYVLDLQTGVYSLESIGEGGGSADGDSHSPDISADGQFVAFVSEAGNLVSTPTAGTQIFVRDRQAGSTRLVSSTVNGRPASGPSRDPAISSDGSVVVFESGAGDLLESSGDAPVSPGIYLVGLASGVRMRVDAWEGRTRPSGQSMSPAISGDGRVVVFATRADLTCRTPPACRDEPADRNRLTDVYVRDVEANTIRRISRGPSGGDPDGASYDPAISGNGRFVAFVSEASNLTRATKPRAAQVYVHDLKAGITTLVSRTGAGHPGNGRSLRPVISHDGSLIAFQSLACDLPCKGKCGPGERDINLLWDVFVHDRISRLTTRISADDGAEWMEESRAPSMDGSGRIMVFSSRHPVGPDDLRHDEDLFIHRRSQ